MLLKIGLLQHFDSKQVKSLELLLPEHEILSLNPKSELINDQIKDIEVLIGANATDDLIEAASSLKLFHAPWVGLDRINFDALEKKQIPICNSKWNARIVAEYALALLLTGLKQLIPIHNDFVQGSWKLRATPSRLLTNSNVLLIGFGSIGHELAKLLKPFTKNIIALRNNPDKSTAEDQELVDKIIGWNKYNEEIGSVDFVINSLPLTSSTHGILTRERLFAMKKDAYYVNVGRGKTTNEKALYDLLQTNQIAGAAIDVWYNYKSSSDEEPVYPSQYPFHKLKNIIMSPHRAATFSDVAPESIWSDVVFNVKALSSNKPLRNVISYKTRY